MTCPSPQPSALLQALQLGPLRLPNRMVMAPMSRNLAGNLPRHHRIGDAALRVVVKFVKDHGCCDAREDFRAKFALRVLLYQALHRFVFRFAQRHDPLRPDVTGEDDIPLREIEDSVSTGGQPRGIQQLQ